MSTVRITLDVTVYSPQDWDAIMRATGQAAADAVDGEAVILMEAKAVTP